MTEKTDFVKTTVIENMKLIDKMFSAGLLLALTSILLKLVGSPQIEFLEVKIDVKWAWVIALLFTVAHLYLAILFMKSTFRLQTKQSSDECLKVFEEITSTGGLLVRGLTPRRLKKGSENDNVYDMDPHDPSAWLAVFSIIVIFISIIPFDARDSVLGGYLLIAFSIIMSNWIIGTNWIVSLSELGGSRHSLRYQGWMMGDYYAGKPSDPQLPRWMTSKKTYILNTILLLLYGIYLITK